MNRFLDGLQRLWAPWRMKYINSIPDTPGGECIFCTKPAENEDVKNCIVHRGEHCFVILNIYPYNNGHLMVVPYKHTPNLSDLDDAEKLDIMNTVDVVLRAMKSIMNPDGFNIGMNMGRSAGAGITEHLHVHIVPRWTGDTNFMPIIGGTKVISESLDDTAKKIGDAIRGVLDEDK